MININNMPFYLTTPWEPETVCQTLARVASQLETGFGHLTVLLRASGSQGQGVVR